MQVRGKYIVIEGQDATGKSTQVQLLRAFLAERDIESIEFHEPEDETIPMTAKLREVIKDSSLERDALTNLLLFTAARHEIWDRRARKELALGKWVVASRNFFSTLTYQGYGEGLDLAHIEATTRANVGEDYINPDFAVILSLENEEERLRRLTGRGAPAKPDTFESRDAGFQRRVTEGYLEVAKTYNLPVVPADRSPEDVQKEIRALLNEKGLLRAA